LLGHAREFFVEAAGLLSDEDGARDGLGEGATGGEERADLGAVADFRDGAPDRALDQAAEAGALGGFEGVDDVDAGVELHLVSGAKAGGGETGTDFADEEDAAEEGIEARAASAGVAEQGEEQKAGDDNRPEEEEDASGALHIEHEPFARDEGVDRGEEQNR